jgi:hypothetical protein
MSLFTFGFIGSVGPEDGHEELLAAVKGLINSGINLTKYYLNVIPKYLLSEGVVLNVQVVLFLAHFGGRWSLSLV